MAAQAQTTEENVAIHEVDGVIGKMEELYRSVTGANPPVVEGAYAPIPLERDPERHVQEQLDRLLSMLGAAGVPAPDSTGAFSPLILVVESETELFVRVDLPGVAREDLNVILRANELTVHGVRRQEVASDQRIRLGETLQGPFARKVLLPPNLRPVEPQARLKDGVLEIRLAKPSSEEMAPKNVKIH